MATLQGYNVTLADGSTATTQSASDNTTKVATTAYVDAAAGGGGAGEVWVGADSWGLTNATALLLIVGANSSWSAIEYANAADEGAAFSFEIPAGKTGITSITLFGISLHASANLVLGFQSSAAPVAGGAFTTDNVADTTYAFGDGNTGNIDTLSVPSTAIDGLTLAAGTLVNLRVDRDATSGSDVYEADWQVVGARVVFS